jgi:hypothetical protein
LFPEKQREVIRLLTEVTELTDIPIHAQIANEHPNKHEHGQGNGHGHGKMAMNKPCFQVCVHVLVPVRVCVFVRVLVCIHIPVHVNVCSVSWFMFILDFAMLFSTDSFMSMETHTETD